MSFWKKLEAVDVRIIFLVLWIAVGIPLIAPLNFPMAVSPDTIKYRDAIEALPAGSVVAFGMDVSPAGYGGELGPEARATATHLFRRPLKVIFLTFWETGAPLIENVWRDPFVAAAMKDKKYGVDYVNLGWIPGSETGMSSFATDAWKTLEKGDYKGTKLSDLPIMANVKTVNDVTMLICIETGTPGGPEYLRQWWARNPKLKVLIGALGVDVPATMAYIAAGQVVSMLRGGRGAAEYQKLLNIVTTADIMGSDAMSMSHFVVLVFLVLGNVGYFALKKTRGSPVKT
jgi:hypothetical protein